LRERERVKRELLNLLLLFNLLNRVVEFTYSLILEKRKKLQDMNPTSESSGQEPPEKVKIQSAQLSSLLSRKCARNEKCVREVKFENSSGDPHGRCQGLDCLPHPHTGGQGLCGTSSGN
jgi:hypothetical protein